MSKKEVDHTNIFESFFAQEVFVQDILHKIACDWKRSQFQQKKQQFNRENFDEFVRDEFLRWIDLGVDEFCVEEFIEE